MDKFIDIVITVCAIWLGVKVVKGIVKALIFVGLGAYLLYRFGII